MRVLSSYHRSNANTAKLTWRVGNKTFATSSEYNLDRVEFDPPKNYQLEYQEYVKVAIIFYYFLHLSSFIKIEEKKIIRENKIAE